jgi:MarR family transcriptional regulator, transcriptional regulator for hemolysin
LLQYDFEQSVGYWLTLTTQAYHRAFNEELAPHGITYRQSQVVAWLAVEEELSQAELAARMLIEPPTLVGILDRMERDGWITRESCTTDRRKKLIRLTPGVEPVWSKIVSCAKKVRAQATEGLSAEESQILLSLLRKVHQNVSERTPIECRQRTAVSGSTSRVLS